MTDRAVLKSPDGDLVAIRSDFPADGTMAYGVMRGKTDDGGGGGHWASADEVSQWLSPPSGDWVAPTPPAEPEAAAPPADTPPSAPDPETPAK